MTHKIIELFGNTLKVFEDGKVLVKRFNRDEYYEKKCGKHKDGYLQLGLTHKGKRKTYLVHRIIAYTFLNLDIENKKSQVDHKDRNRLNNVVSNLHIVTHQQNQFNTNAKGYSWHKLAKKWRAQIRIDGKNKHLGLFEKEEDAKQVYEDAKLIHHII